jgi:hypothetical protein
MTIKEVYTYYSKLANKDKKEVQTLYNKLMSGNHEGLGKVIENLKEISFLEKPDQSLYLFCRYFFDYKINKITRPSYIEQVKSLINYNEILYYDVITLYEMLILSNLIKDVSKSEKDQIVKLLTKTIRSTNVDDISSIDYYLVIIYTIAKYYGLEKDYSNAFEMCDRGINISKKYHHYYLLAQLYYFKAIFYKALMKTHDKNEMIHLCISVLEVSINNDLSSKIKGLIEKDFNINIINFEENYWSNKKKTTNS